MRTMLEKQAEMKQHCLELLPAQDTFAGYPSVRFQGATDTLLTIPNGPWDTENVLPDDETMVQLEKTGHTFDSRGRPVHPWLTSIIQTTGAVAGRGFYWSWGRNRTVDPIVICDKPRPSILLILRGDNKKWALPGGFLDPSEFVFDAALRECEEETGIHLGAEPDALVYQGPVADQRSTAHAWGETTALLWVTNNMPIPRAGDDAQDAQWFELNNLPANLHGSHQKLIAFGKSIIERQ